jgi:hypothetical protein
MSSSENLSGRLDLYVEDALTKQYLEALFQYESGWLNITPVWGREAVRAMVMAERDRGKQAFGWQDRDFGEDNIAKWGQADTYVFRGEYHEIENYMLDWEAMKEGEKSSGDFLVEQVARGFAKKMVFAVACCSELRALQRFIGEDFPSFPLKQSEIDALESLDDAVRFIRNQPKNNPWIPRITSNCANRTSEGFIRRNVGEKAARLNTALDDGSWRIVMPGKEIFRHVLHQVFQGNIDEQSFAKSIADWQRENQKIPAELQKLIGVLKKQYDS